MYGKSLLVGAALLPGLAVAGHAKEDWPEPVKEYYTGQVLFDRLELTRTNEEENLAVWDMMAWYGGDYHRAVFKSEGRMFKTTVSPLTWKVPNCCMDTWCLRFGRFRPVLVREVPYRRTRLWKIMLS